MLDLRGMLDPATHTTPLSAGSLESQTERVSLHQGPTVNRLVSVIRVATRILFSLRSWPLPPPHSAGIGRYVPTSVLTADSDCDFRLVTADSHIWKGYQGRSPWLVKLVSVAKRL